MSNEISMDKENKQLFLNTLNKKGFLLEEETHKVIDGLKWEFMQKNRVITHNNIRREIDFIVHVKDRVFILECKKSDYDFIFTKSIHLSNTINLIIDTQKGMTIGYILGSKDLLVTWSEHAMMFNGNNPKMKNKNEKVALSSHNLIHDSVKQVLVETEAFLCRERFINKSLFPIIVTNSRLLYLDFEDKHIDNSGNLTDYNGLKEVPFLVYNFPEIMFWDNNAQMLKSRTSYESSHDNIKSIFFVNVNYLQDLIKMLCKDDYLPPQYLN